MATGLLIVRPTKQRRAQRSARLVERLQADTIDNQ